VKRSPYLTVGSAVVRAVPAKGVYPQAYISGKEAETACKNSGKGFALSLNGYLPAKDLINGHILTVISTKRTSAMIHISPDTTRYVTTLN
ncbi:MAG: hypothetical protein N3B13_10575, partial [Deltaproteobacteria bacterium]|nr:hypothetical protein [Deltaproteobacteria bacterium]